MSNTSEFEQLYYCSHVAVADDHEAEEFNDYDSADDDCNNMAGKWWHVYADNYVKGNLCRRFIGMTEITCLKNVLAFNKCLLILLF